MKDCNNIYLKKWKTISLKITSRDQTNLKTEMSSLQVPSEHLNSLESCAYSTRNVSIKVIKSCVTSSSFSIDEGLRVSRNVLLQYTSQWQKQHFHRLRSLVFDTLLPKSSPEMSPRAAFLFQPNSATSIVLCVRCQWIFLKVFAYDEFFSVRSFKLISFIPLQVHPRLFSLK